MSSPKKVIFFDLDETLYPAERVYDIGIRYAWRAFQNVARPISWKVFKRLYDRARSDVKRGIEGFPSSHNRTLYFKRLTELYFGRLDSSAALAMARAYERCWTEIDVQPIRGLLGRLARRYRLGIITNQIGLTQLQKMERIDPEGRFFPVMVTSEEVGVEKPHPKIFRTACARAGCRPSEAYMVGDNWRDDVAGALRAGLTPIFLSPKVPPLRSPRVRWIRSLAELPGVLNP